MRKTRIIPINRTLTVSSVHRPAQTSTGLKAVPSIRLTGVWLEDFTRIGEKFRIELDRQQRKITLSFSDSIEKEVSHD